MSDPLTPIERKVYHYLLDFLAENTYQPSVREIGRRLRIRSTKTVTEILQSLAEKGFVERQHGRSRGVKIVGYSALGGVQPVPLYARVNPVAPYVTSENRERFVALDRALLPSDDVFLIRASGNDMIGRGVLNGDLVLVSPSTRARDGDLVAARVGAHLYLRIVTHMGAVLSLSTGLSGEREIFLGPSDDFAVLGVVVVVIRATRLTEQDGETRDPRDAT
jgi:repressor LexA